MVIRSTSSIPESHQPAPDWKLNRMLVVDDVALNREIFITHLGDAVRHVDEAADGWSALTLFKQHHYDAVLLDIEMPGLDGYGALNEMRSWEREFQIPATPVVAITSSDFPEDEQRILAAGATTYLAKPVKRRDLMAALHLHCSTEQSLHAGLLPRFFACADTMLDEMNGVDKPEVLAKKLHQLRGMIAVYGFADFAMLLREIHLVVKRGEMPEQGVFERLREELQSLKTAPPKD